MQDANRSHCRITATLAHGIGHAVAFPSSPKHNKGDNGDKVYRIGKAEYKLSK